MLETPGVGFALATSRASNSRRATSGVKLLALPYADREGYQESWRP